MGIVPPDPGKALQLAKDCTYDPVRRAFSRTGPLGPAHRWLVAVAGEWAASATGERLVPPETYKLLRGGEPAPEGPFFVSGGVKYALVDDGFEAVAVEV